MSANPIDVRRTLSFGTGTQDMLGLGGGLAIFCFALYFQQTQRPDFKAWMFMALGLAIAAWALARLFNPKPGLVLSERGVSFRVPGVRSVFIPWREVRAIDTLDIPVSKGAVKDVTVITISKLYYDKRVHTNTWTKKLLPDWNQHFSLMGDRVQVALHHQSIGVDGAMLRAEVEARWRAFGGERPTAVRASP